MEQQLFLKTCSASNGVVKEPGGRAPVGRQDRPRHDSDAYDASKKHRPTMLTTDLSLRFDPAYENFHGGSGASGAVRRCVCSARGSN